MLCVSLSTRVRLAAAAYRWPAFLLAWIGALLLGAGAATATVSSPATATEEQRARLQIDVGVHSAPVRRLSVQPGKGLAVTASDDKTARIWDAKTGQLRHVLRPGVGSGEIGRLYGAALHPNEPLVAVGGTTGSAGSDHRILLFSTTTGRLLRALDARGGDIKHLAWTPDGRLLFATYSGEHAIRAFTAEGDLVFEQRLPAPSYGLAVAGNGRVAATVMDGTAILLEAGEGRVTASRKLRTKGASPVSVSFSPDGSRLLVGFHEQAQPPQVFDAIRGASLGFLAVPPVRIGNFMSVAWSPDRRLIVAAGTARDFDRRHEAFFFDASDLRFLGRQPLASDTILDLEGLPEGQFAFASFDGSWGIFSQEASSVRVEAPAAPERLLISPGARQVQWSFDGGRHEAFFDFDTRTLTANAGPRLGSLATIALENTQWTGVRTIETLGSRITLAADEVSRSHAYLSRGQQALLGTSQRLIRLKERARIQWEVRTAAEVRAIRTSADERVAVTAMSDGTLRWWRTSDGVLLLSLLATPQGQWVAWTESGYFDASPGADRLAGWAVNRPAEPAADFFSLNRFRGRFNRPDLVDRVLANLQPVAVPRTLNLPPVVNAGEQLPLRADRKELAIPYAVTPGSPGAVSVEVRIDGRPAPDAAVTAQVDAKGEVTGEARLSDVSPGSLVQVVAHDANGSSEPLQFLLEKDMPAALALAQPIPPPTPAGSALALPETGVMILTPSPPLRPAPMQPLQPPAAAVGAPPPPPDASVPLRPPATGKVARLFVLAIGISQYRKAEYRLGLAAKDARDFSHAMARQTGRLYNDVSVRALTDGEATREAVLQSLRWLSDSVGPRDVGIMFFAGHGLNAVDQQYYFLPHDADHERLAQTAVPEEEIRKALARMRGKALLFVDTCFGGSALSRAGSSEIARMANNLSATENGVVVFASSSGRQLSEEHDEWGNGAFTKAVLAGLEGKADLTRTGRVTFKGLDFYVSEEVRKLTQGRQTPVTISPTGVPDFPLAELGTS